MEDEKLSEDSVVGTEKAELTDATVTKKRGMPKISRRWLIVGAVVVAVLAVTIFAFISGRLAVVVKSPTQKVVVSETVCADTVIQNYNSAVEAYYKGDVTQLDVLGSMIDDFSKNASYIKDPNCMFIKYQLAILKSDYVTAKDAADTLKQLFNKGMFASGNLSGLLGADGMDAQLNIIQPSDDKDQYVD